MSLSHLPLQTVDNLTYTKLRNFGLFTINRKRTSTQASRSTQNMQSRLTRYCTTDAGDVASTQTIHEPVIEQVNGYVTS